MVCIQVKHFIRFRARKTCAHLLPHADYMAPRGRGEGDSRPSWVLRRTDTETTDSGQASYRFLMKYACSNGGGGRNDQEDTMLPVVGWLGAIEEGRRIASMKRCPPGIAQIRHISCGDKH